MKNRFILFQRSGVYYCEDTTTGKQSSLRTRDKADAVRLRRWVVERTFGWLMHQRRLVRDYETTEASAAAWIYIAMIRIQLRRLA